MITRNKNYFYDKLRDTGINKNDAKKILSIFLDSIIAGLIEDGEVNIKNFGKFVLTKKKKNIFINPKTGKVSKIKFSEKVKFIPSVNLIDYVNSNE